MSVYGGTDGSVGSMLERRGDGVHTTWEGHRAPRRRLGVDADRAGEHLLVRDAELPGRLGELDAVIGVDDRHHEIDVLGAGGDAAGP